MEAAANANPSNVQVQHVTKKSSDELLRKFAELEDDGDKASARTELRVVVKRRRQNGGRASRRRESGGYGQCESPTCNGSSSLVERKWLLHPAAAATRRSTLLRQLGIGRSQLRAREIRNRTLFGTIEKTWRRTIEGASKVLMAKHYNRHRRLINELV
ncbi:hypothetical protein DITRI_Ditri12bG0115200 [Diplodiscus trichospermus]